MRPPVASPQLASRRIDVDAPIELGRWRWFAMGLFGVGAAIGAALIISGRPLPQPVPVLALAVFVVFAVNRFAFFPTELAVTAEAAVLVAAVVAFRHDSPLVGPWCVAFLAGPLDLLHWRQRSFIRMAYNAGNRMVATLAGAATFLALSHLGAVDVGVLHLGGASPGAGIAGAALGASLVFALVEGAVGVLLLRLRNGESWPRAACIEFPLELLTVPLAMIGASAGYLATGVGWWAAALVLTPTLFVPELAFARSRRGTAITRVVATLGPAMAGVVVLALVVPFPATSTLLALVVIALVAGLELRVDVPVPPIVAALIAAAVVVGGDAILSAAVVVAIVATGIAWIMARETNSWAPVLAGGAALAAAAVYDARPSRAAALAVALVFQLLIVAGLSRVVWTAPFVCVAVALADVWRSLGIIGAAVFGVGLAAVFVAAAACGAPPWGSRVVGRWVVRHRPRAQRAIVAAVAACSFSCAIAACALGSTHAIVAVASATAATVGAMAMCAVRQWRFSPRLRARDATLALAAVVSVVVAYPAVATSGTVWSVVLLGASLIVCTSIAWPLVRLAALTTRAPEAGQPEALTR
jgi:hypothetical protein